MIFFSKNIKKVLSILFAKKKFSPPSQKKYVILDEKGSKIFEKYLNYQEVEILDTRFKTINLFILFKIIFKFKFSLKDYIVEYINRTNCKFIITFLIMMYFIIN